MTRFGLVAVLIAGLAGAAAQAAAADDAPTVRIHSGLIRGSGTDVRVFKGIPYAAPPVGKLRWRAPQPIAAWSGVRSATEFGKACVQPGRDVPMSEDCLHLNVWTPAHAKNLPVMVWIHGGGWLRGTSAEPAFEGTQLARRGVVLVTVDFRLGVLGFLAHPALSAETPEHVSSNYGIRDLVAALRWVHDNIASFGGNPGNVTIFGQSSGAQAVCDLMIVPQARGLFQRGIMESAPVMRPGYVQMTLSQAEQDGRRYGDDIAKLRALSPAELMALTPALEPEMRANIANALYPVRDGLLLPLDEKTAFATGRVAHVPVIVGNNTDEGSFYAPSVPVKTLAAMKPYLEARFGPLAGEAAKLYPATDDQSANHAQGTVTSDTLTWGVRELARNMSRLAPTWRYLFSHARNGVQPMHTSEIPFVYGNQINYRTSKPELFSDTDKRVSDFMQQAWVNFARIGNPNGPGLPVAWPRFDREKHQFLEIGDDPQIITGWRDAEIDFIGRTLRR